MIFNFEVQVQADSIADLARIASHIEGKWPELRDKQLRRIGENFVEIERLVINREVEWTGELAGSVGYKVEDNRVTIGPNVPSETIDTGKVAGIHQGAGPRWVPMGDLLPWVQGKLGGDIDTAIFIQRRIAGAIPDRDGGTSEWQRQRHGRDGFPFSQETLESGEATQELEAVTVELAEEIVKMVKLLYSG